MEPERLDNKLDEWLDETLAEYGRADPRPGFEARTVAGLRHRIERRHWWSYSQRPIWLSAVAVTIAIFVVLLFVKREKPYPPDLTKGNDQELLLGVDRLLNKEVPAALEPALVLTKEIVKK